MDPDEIIIRQPEGSIDYTNTQVGPEITRREHVREGHYHSAEDTFGAQDAGIEVDLAAVEEERLADERGRDEILYLAEGYEAGSARAAAQGSEIHLYVMAHPDDEMTMWLHPHTYGNSSSVHQVFAIMTQGDQTNYCNAPAVDRPNEIPPTPAPNGLWSDACEQARMNSFFGFMGEAGALYSSIDSSYSHVRNQNFKSSSPVNPCRRDDTEDGGDDPSNSWPFPRPLGLDYNLDALYNTSPDDRWDCHFFWDADNVDIYAGATGRSTVLFFNLGDGDVSEGEVRWAIDRIRLQPEPMELPDLPITHVISPFINDNQTYCDNYSQPDHLAVRRAVRTQPVPGAIHTGATCYVNVWQPLPGTIPTSRYQTLFRSPPSQPVQATSVHDRHYGWLRGLLWSEPYVTDCGATSVGNAGEVNCLHSRTQHFWMMGGTW